ncbi:sigma-70 family RNA polymerase sigma factor [Nonomuraea sp. NPDC003709]|uniref:RNA polymerase sigma factor n=1 Tax=Nonomuraea sp. NPDC003709 TaxID=3154450 RepID=UPI0033B570B3
MSDQTGFTGLFEEHYEEVLRYAWRRVGAADAPDVAAETFRIAWEKYDRLPHDQPLPWLYTTARHVVSNHIRSGTRRDGLAASLAEGLLRHGAESDHAAIVAARHAALAALDNLNEDDRELVLLLAWEGLDLRQSAKAVGCSWPTARMRLHRARKRLHRLLTADGQATAAHSYLEGLT